MTNLEKGYASGLPATKFTEVIKYIIWVTFLVALVFILIKIFGG